MSQGDQIFVNSPRVMRVDELEKIVGARANGMQSRYKGTAGNDNQFYRPE